MIKGSFRLAVNLLWPATGPVNCSKNRKFPTVCSNAFRCDSCCNLKLVWTKLKAKKLFTFSDEPRRAGNRFRKVAANVERFLPAKSGAWTLHQASVEVNGFEIFNLVTNVKVNGEKANKSIHQIITSNMFLKYTRTPSFLIPNATQYEIFQYTHVRS